MKEGVNPLFSGFLKIFIINPTPVHGGGVLSTPYQKIAIAPKINDPCKPKLGDFSYISMTNTPYPFGPQNRHKNMSFQHFFSSDV